jgi:hypothetical protein
MNDFMSIFSVLIKLIGLVFMLYCSVLIAVRIKVFCVLCLFILYFLSGFPAWGIKGGVIVDNWMASLEVALFGAGLIFVGVVSLFDLRRRGKAGDVS